MLLFCCAPSSGDEASSALSVPVVLDADLSRVARACDGRVYVVESRLLEGLEAAGPDRWTAAQVGRPAIKNIDPYRPPEPLVAAGGLIVRPGTSEPELLVIFRKGVWDLPKGKLKKGETPQEGALREVSEETGAAQLEPFGDAGTTIHGYPANGLFLVKTTHWFYMYAGESRFQPEEREGIVAVEWTPWSEAIQCVGFATLQELLQREQETARAVVRKMEESGLFSRP